MVITGEKVGNKSRIRFYIDGVFKEQNDENGTGTWTGYTEKLGVFQNYSALNGHMDDLRVYVGKVLSQAQITELYQNNTFYKFPTAETKYIGSSASTGITYNFELENEDEKIISHY